MSTKDYIIILHGLFRTSRSMNKLEKELNKVGYEVININYPTTSDSIENLVRDVLAPIIEEKYSDHNKKIHFITHSMGGIMVRWYLENYELKNLGRVIMIAPPNQGSPYAERLSKSAFANWLFGPALKQMNESEESLPKKMKSPQYEVGVIAGKYDQKTPPEVTKLEGMKDYLEVPQFHTFIMNDDKVIKGVKSFLETGNF